MTTTSSLPVSATVYSVVWPETEALVRQCMTQESEAMLARHRVAHTKHQDRLHDTFFAAWRAAFAGEVHLDPAQFPETYPTAGSSEAIREVIRTLAWTQRDLVVFEGEYEGYEAIAMAQGTRVHRVDRQRWAEQLAQWQTQGVPWGPAGAQWWVSQPSALDGMAWADFVPWLTTVATLPGCEVWVDLCYIGATTVPVQVDLNVPVVAGVVFSLSKVMGAYYRRIGGCWARQPVAGLWPNRWFKNLDSLYLGERWLQTLDLRAWRLTLAERQAWAMDQAGLTQVAWGGAWRPSEVALLAHADPTTDPSLSDAQQVLWTLARRGTARTASRRLCLTPTLDPLQEMPHDPLV